MSFGIECAWEQPETTFGSSVRQMRVRVVPSPLPCPPCLRRIVVLSDLPKSILEPCVKIIWRRLRVGDALGLARLAKKTVWRTKKSQTTRYGSPFLKSRDDTARWSQNEWNATWIRAQDAEADGSYVEIWVVTRELVPAIGAAPQVPFRVLICRRASAQTQTPTGVAMAIDHQKASTAHRRETRVAEWMDCIQDIVAPRAIFALSNRRLRFESVRQMKPRLNTNDPRTHPLLGPREFTVQGLDAATELECAVVWSPPFGAMAGDVDDGEVTCRAGEHEVREILSTTMVYQRGRQQGGPVPAQRIREGIEGPRPSETAPRIRKTVVAPVTNVATADDRSRHEVEEDEIVEICDSAQPAESSESGSRDAAGERGVSEPSARSHDAGPSAGPRDEPAQAGPVFVLQRRFSVWRLVVEADEMDWLPSFEFFGFRGGKRHRIAVFPRQRLTVNWRGKSRWAVPCPICPSEYESFRVSLIDDRDIARIFDVQKT